MASSPEEIQKHVKLYWMIGFTLFGCSAITLALGIFAPFDFGAPGVSGSDIVIGLLVAVVKSSLVMLIFMHLNNERGLIYKTLLFTLAFSISLMGLTLFAQSDPIPEHASVYQRVEYVDSDAEVDSHAKDGAHH
ncbi:MAG: caa(3)-type oxidase subunit IV [Verrucomicrobiales bacterium]|jgi:caa(3)-type oxidase subunit IV